MILQALVQQYESLVGQGRLERPGWATAKVSYALHLSPQGVLERVTALKLERAQGKKAVLAPREISLPAPVKRTAGIASNFLWDNSSYILGVDSKGRPERSKRCFAACRTLHQKLLEGVDSPEARAVLAFFESWDPEKAAEHPALQSDWEDLTAGVNLIFRCGDLFPHEDPALRQAWQAHYDGEESGPEMVCLVTGQKGVAQAVHPAIKGLRGAQSSGAALVSFNAPAFCSYGRSQNLNAPVSRYAAFAYTAALNYMLADREHLCHVGDTTVLFWAKDGRPAYQNLFGGFGFGQSTPYSEGDLEEMALALFGGRSILYEGEKLDPQMDFYILGLAPNAARLSVRFFLHNTFGEALENVRRHYERLQIARPAFDPYENIPLWKLLGETVNQNARDKAPAPNLAGETLRAILTNTRYPATLRNGVALRIRADHEITRGRAAILKAYYLMAPHPDIRKEEVLTVSLNPDSTNTAYNLGRLFSVLEDIQQKAQKDITTTIRDKYFNSASATPSRVFPLLVNLAQKHLRKLDKGVKTNYSKQLTGLFDRLGESYPDHMSLPQQGAFQLGYYHQTQARYQKKEEKENG